MMADNRKRNPFARAARGAGLAVLFGWALAGGLHAGHALLSGENDPRLLDLHDVKLADEADFLRRLAERDDWIAVRVWTHKITDAGLAALAECADLRRLTLVSQNRREVDGKTVPAITPAGLAALKKLPALERLVLGDVDFDAVLPMLAEFPALKELHMEGPWRFTDAGAEALARFPVLETLTLSGGSYGPPFDGEVKTIDLSVKSLEAVARNPALRRVRLLLDFDTDATRAMDALAPLTELKEVYIGETKFDDAALTRLVGRWPGLESPPMLADPISDAGFAALLSLGELRSLDLGGNATDDRLRLLAEHCPKIKELHLGGDQMGARGVDALAGFPELVQLTLTGASITRTENLARLAAAAPNVKTLYLWDAAPNDAALAAVAAMPALADLFAVGFSRQGPGEEAPAPVYGDAGLRALAGCPTLTSIALYAPGDLTDDGLFALSALPKLRVVALKPQGGVTPEGVERLKAAVPTLAFVNLMK